MARTLLGGIALVLIFGYGCTLGISQREGEEAIMDPCQTCMGTGLDPATPSRVTRVDAPKRAVLSLLIPCGACEGRGVLPCATDRDLTRASVLR